MPLYKPAKVTIASLSRMVQREDDEGRGVFIISGAHHFCQICEHKIRHQVTICLSNGSGGRINGTAMVGGALLQGGIMKDVVFAAQHPERSWQFQIMTAILDVFVLSEGRPRCFPTVAGYVATPAILSKGSDPCAPIDSHLQPTCKEECPGKDTFA